MKEEAYKQLLEKQGYRFIGSHSAVKICEWTKKSIVDNGVCYKQKFYGINCHRCAQISVTTNYCDQDCVYCWRRRANFPFKKIDSPKEIIEKAFVEQRKLLTGFGGNRLANRKKLEEAQQPMHFAISLTGETLHYPKLSELIREIKRRKMTSFVVSNGQLPEVLEKLTPPTQLYISVSAPNKELHKKICKPLHKDAWERLLKTLKIMKKLKKKTRTTIRITLIKDLNMVEPEQYAKLIESASPNFVEVKAYMYVGASIYRLKRSNMPYHKDVKDFVKKICKYCGYKIIDEQPESRVVLLMKKDDKKRIMSF